VQELRIQIERKVGLVLFFMAFNPANEIPTFWDLCIQVGLALMNNVWCICIPGGRELKEHGCKGCQQYVDFVQVVFVLMPLRKYVEIIV